MQNFTTRETGKQQIKDDEVVLIRLGKLPATFAIACYIVGKRSAVKPLAANWETFSSSSTNRMRISENS